MMLWLLQKIISHLIKKKILIDLKNYIFIWNVIVYIIELIKLTMKDNFEEIPQVKKRELNFLLNKRNEKIQKFLV